MTAGIRAGSSNDGYVQVNGNDIITALSSGNVGIGNTSPSTKLHVNGDITATNFIGNVSGNPTFAGDLTIPQWIIHAGDTDTKLGFPSADAVDIFAGGKQVRLTSAGHLGINRTTPAAPITARRLDAGGTGTNGVIAEFANNGGYGVWFGQSSASGASWGATTGDFYWNTGGLSSQVERLRINSTGKVTVKSNAANSVAIALVDNDSSNEIWRVGQAADGDGYVEVLEDGGTVGCKLDASGNSFTMGNFGVGVSSPSQILEVLGGSAAKPTFKHSAGWGALRVAGSAGGSGSGIIFANNYSGTIEEKWSIYLDGANDGLRFTAGPPETTTSEKLRITSDGKIGISMTNPHVELDIFGDASSRIVLRTVDGSSTSNHANLSFCIGSGSAPASGNTIGVIESNVTATGGACTGDLRFYTNPGDSLTERLRITSDGLVKWAGHTLSARNSATGVAGGMIYNTDAKVFQYHDGSGWNTLTSNNQIVATGGNTVSTSGGYRIHDFVGNATFEITSGVGEVEILVVGGGGSEGGDTSGCHAGGGGGGGGVVYQKRILHPGKYAVIVGAGGLWRNNGATSRFGNNWSHSTIYAYGGGAGGPTLTGNGNDGGSGGGSSRHTNSNVGGSATQPVGPDGGFGNAGGNTGPTNTNPGGGGGAGGAGTNGDGGGAGGAGKQFTQFGVNIYFGAGGSSGGQNNGAANTGAGAGGSAGGSTRYYGGSGRVMVRYPAAS